MAATLEIRDVPGKGRGVFAACDFRKNEIVCEYKGELLTEAEGVIRSAEYDQQALDRNIDVFHEGCYMYWFAHDGNLFCLDAGKDDGSFGRLINHSKRDANLRPQGGVFKPRIMFYAARAIQKGEELLYDYGEDDPEILEKFPWLCT
jgi:SET domain-containing protein